MTKTERVGKLPVNSRIFVSHLTDPPTIDFEYPDPNQSAIRNSDAVFLISFLVTIFMMLILSSLFFLFISPKLYPHATTFDTTINNITIINYQYTNGTIYGFNNILVNYTWNDENYSSRLTLSREGLFITVPILYDIRGNTVSSYILIIQAISVGVLFLLLLFINAFWISKLMINTKWGNRYYPELNKKMHDAHYSAEFTAANFPVDKNIIEIPLFKNMYMDYDATGDFAEQLIKVSIIEHPFNRLVKKGLPRLFRKKDDSKNIIKKTNVYLWKCVLEFKDKPKDGQLVLRWTAWFIMCFGAITLLHLL